LKVTRVNKPLVMSALSRPQDPEEGLSKSQQAA
jgi:hypothetical protein